MVEKVTETVRGRRHGQALESALAAAGWDELVEVGYARLTMGSVANRARTSEAVLYRRWANKDRLVLAALEHHRNANPVTVVETGDLRGDLLAELSAVSVALSGYFAIAAAASFSGLLSDTGLTPAQVRDRVMGVEASPPLRSLYRRAQDRGQIVLDNVPAAVLSLPFDLVRHDMLMDLGPVRPERIRAIVDEIFLPLIASYHGEPVRNAPDRAP